MTCPTYQSLQDRYIRAWLDRDNARVVEYLREKNQHAEDCFTCRWERIPVGVDVVEGVEYES